MECEQRREGPGAILVATGVVLAAAVETTVGTGSWVNVLLVLAAVAGFLLGAWTPTVIAALGVLAIDVAFTVDNQRHFPHDHALVNDLVFGLIVVGAPAWAGATLVARERQVSRLGHSPSSWPLSARPSWSLRDSRSSAGSRPGFTTASSSSWAPSLCVPTELPGTHGPRHGGRRSLMSSRRHGPDWTRCVRLWGSCDRTLTSPETCRRRSRSPRLKPSHS